MRVEFLAASATGATNSRSVPAHIALIGNAMPRRCGLATYSSHSRDALLSRFPGMMIDHYAMDDGHGGLVYPPDITTIAQHDPMAYRDAADAINASEAELIWLQHEFGIFGGTAGECILTLLDRTSLPVIATLHTLLTEPSADEDRVFRALIDRAAILIVMAERGREILTQRYGVHPDKIRVIPHGVPARALIDSALMKTRLGLPQRPAIMTFGLLAPNKGIETMISALPAIVRAHPDAFYYVLGATHPSLIRDNGENYRDSLIALAEELGVADHIRFEDRFFDEETLLDWLQAADVYATPYTNPQQITSGALSYAVAMGKPVVSTPYVHAQEILADGHGILVPFGDSAAFAKEIIALLSDAERRERLIEQAWQRGQTMSWGVNAERVVESMIASRVAQPVALSRKPRAALPEPSLDLGAVRRMTDDTGMFQHSNFGIPDRHHGYCIDDNARALILACLAAKHGVEGADELAHRYAAFVHYAWNNRTGMFRNFMGFDRQWLEDSGSDDSNGRTLWSIGVAAANAPSIGLREWAVRLYDIALPVVDKMDSPRAIAFAILGATAMLGLRPQDVRSRSLLKSGGRLLCDLVAQSRRPDWIWFEPVLAYDNARLPEALIRAGAALRDEAMLALGLDTLRWITSKQTAQRGHFRPVGSDSFGHAYSDPRPFDQQPLEAHATIDAAVAAWQATGDAAWLATARTAFDWFHGENDLAMPLASPADGGCFDGLMPRGINRNQGAESILALQLAACTLLALPQEVPQIRPSRVHGL